MSEGSGQEFRSLKRGSLKASLKEGVLEVKGFLKVGFRVSNPKFRVSGLGPWGLEVGGLGSRAWV